MDEYTSEEEEKTTSKKLHEKFKTLERDYEEFTKSSLKTRHQQFYPCDSYYAKSNKHKKSHSSINKKVFDNSPRNLMSSLQHASPIRSNNNEVWKVRTNELAKEETRRDRKLDFENGKLKGRRLFEGDDEEILCGLPEVINVEKGELSARLVTCSDYYFKGDFEEEKFVVKEVMNEEKKGVGENKRIGVSKGKSMVLKICMFLILMLFVVRICIGFDGYERGNEIVLYPT